MEQFVHESDIATSLINMIAQRRVRADFFFLVKAKNWVYSLQLQKSWNRVQRYIDHFYSVFLPSWSLTASVRNHFHYIKPGLNILKFTF